MRDEVRSRSVRTKAMQGLKIASVESDVFPEMTGAISRQNSMRGVGVDGLRLTSSVGVSTLEVEDLGLAAGAPRSGTLLAGRAWPRSASPYLVLGVPVACGAAGRLCDKARSFNLYLGLNRVPLTRSQHFSWAIERPQYVASTPPHLYAAFTLPCSLQAARRGERSDQLDHVMRRDRPLRKLDRLSISHSTYHKQFLHYQKDGNETLKTFSY